MVSHKFADFTVKTNLTLPKCGQWNPTALDSEQLSYIDEDRGCFLLRDAYGVRWEDPSAQVPGVVCGDGEPFL